MKKITVSVGIPAYNEESNIKELLISIIGQRKKSFILREIIVVSDCSNDKTDEIVRSFKKKVVKLIVSKKRLGQSPSQEKIIQLFSSDILVLLNADVIPANNLFLEKLIEPFKRNKKIGLVSPSAVPLKARNLFEEIINFSVDCRESMLRSWNKGNNVLHCFGVARAFSKDFAKSIKWPSSVGEDAYTYFLCQKNNYEFSYEPKALIHYRSPDNFGDFRKQSSRFLYSQKMMSDLFGRDLVTRAYEIPFFLTIRSVAVYFFKNPFFWICYAAMFIYICLNPNKAKYSNSLWEISKSSKVLNYHAA